MFKLLNNKGLINYIAACLAAFMICFCGMSTVLAVEESIGTEEKKSEKSEKKEKSENTDEDEDASDDEDEDNDEDKEEKKERKKGEKPVLAEGETGVLIDSVSGRVLFESDSTKKMYPASTTKVMTAMLAIEAVERGEVSMENTVTITPAMLENADPDGSNIALKVGEVITLDNLLKGLMVASGNDAACAIATYISGSIFEFVELMNARAAELGANDTHFVNPHGLHDSEHYTTAADMAKIACAAMKLTKFRNIVDIAHIKIPPTNVTEQERYYINTNGLLSTMRYTNFYFKGSIGIKTGYTSDAGNCLVSAAARDGVELIAVLFGGKDTTYSHKDSIEMLEWGFEEFVSAVAVSKDDMLSEIKVKQGKGTDSLTLSAKESVRVLVPKDTKIEDLEIKPNIPESVYAPIAAETEIGGVTVLLNGEELGSGRLVATKTIERSAFWPVMALGEWLWGMTAVRIFVYVLCGAVVIFIIMFIAAIRRNIRKAKRRRRR